jgi:hypothetical protein
MQAWMVLAQRHQYVGQKDRCGMGADTEPDFSEFMALDQVHIAFEAARFEQDSPRTFQNLLAGGSQSHASCSTIEQEDAKVTLQRLDTAAQGWLTQVHALRCASEGLFFREGDEML